MTTTPIDPVEVQNLSKAYREKTGLTQRGFAAKLATSPGRIGEIERGICRSARVAKEIRRLALAELAEV